MRQRNFWMIFKTGDRVFIKPGGHYGDQAKQHPGLGTIKYETGTGGWQDPGEQELWWRVEMDDGYENNYRTKDLLPEKEDLKMPPPEMELEEIELAQEIYSRL